MKNHISRLTQLSTRKTSESSIKTLQDALNQSLSENEQYAEKIKELEKRLLQSNESGGGIKYISSPNGENITKDDIVECLRLRIDQLEIEIARLTKEKRSADTFRVNETFKLRDAESLVMELEGQLDASSTLIGNLIFV